MSQNEQQQVCPWCQMEIIWDPEFGPENECPHCLNELGGYRTLPLTVDEADDLVVDAEMDEDNEAAFKTNESADDIFSIDSDTEYDDYDEAAEARQKDNYQERVLECLDTQIEVPECFRCQELMLLAGTQKVESHQFAPQIPPALGMPFLPAPFELQLFVCPSCFNTEAMLSPDDRAKMVGIIKS
jgi:hypothetical protein